MWTGEGKGGETLERYFAELGPERARKIETATIDMSPAYISVLEEQSPQAQIVFDRFHVQRLASDAVDEVRRAQVRSLAGTEEAQFIKNTRFALLKNPWDLTGLERIRLSALQRQNKPLCRAYLLKEGLAKLLDYLQLGRATAAFEQWVSWASRSRLKPFVRVARTLRQHKDRILAYIPCRLTNGLTEGLNNKTRLITRRAFGFHSAPALEAMITSVPTAPPTLRSGRKCRRVAQPARSKAIPTRSTRGRGLFNAIPRATDQEPCSGRW